MQSGNKKIRNATSNITDGISFKSRLEASFYKLFRDNGIILEYEPMKFILIQGIKPSLDYYEPKEKKLTLNTKKIIDITYTPDFVCTINNVLCIFELKGFANDVYPVKKKLFKLYLENRYKKGEVLFFEIATIKQAKEALDIINQLKTTTND